MNSLAKLADRGLVQPGTIIELVPSICGSVAPGGSGDRFRAVVVNSQGGEGALRWPVDGQCYSAQALLTKLEREYGVCGISIVYRNWRVVGHEESIWSEAKAYGLGSADEIVPDPPPPLKKPAPGSKALEDGGGTPWLQKGKRDDNPLRPSQARRILIASAKAFAVAIASALGAKFGGWLGGVIAATLAGTFAVATATGSDGGSQGHHS